MADELTQEELEGLEGELLPKREALSVIGPLPAGAPGTDVATGRDSRRSLDLGRGHRGGSRDRRKLPAGCPDVTPPCQPDRRR